MADKISLTFLFLFLFLFPFFFFSLSPTAAQPGQDSNGKLDSLDLVRKTIDAVRISTPPKIDGELSEPFWHSLPVADNFIEYSPRNGTLPEFQTKVMFAYDDMAFYIGAILYDPYPDSICKELGRRDQIELLNTDYISFDILPYNDALNMFEFKVSPANLQSDTKYSPVGQDVYWDAVWESAAQITDQGWVTEVNIPYSALRFPKVEEQVWGINMWKRIRTIPTGHGSGREEWTLSLDSPPLKSGMMKSGSFLPKEQSCLISARSFIRAGWALFPRISGPLTIVLAPMKRL